MGFLGSLFGHRETDEQRIARAQRALDDDEPELAVRTLSSIDGDAAAVVRNRAIAKITAREPEPPEPELVAPLDDNDPELPKQPMQRGLEED